MARVRYICYLLLKSRYKKTLTCYTQLCLFSHFHWTRYFEGVPMCFATVLLYGSYYMRGIQFILFFPEGSQITSFVRIKLLRKGVLLLNTTHAKQDHSLFEFLKGQFSQKTNLKIRIFALAYLGRHFRSFFGRIENTKKSF